MKISKEEKQRTRRRLVEAAVRVIADQGFRQATMREIAEVAEVSDATIYKYFPTKESLLFGYFDIRTDDLIERLQGVPDFHEYRFQEQLHLLLETQFALFAEDRVFIRAAYRGVFLANWVHAASESRAAKERFLEIIDDLVTAAVEAGEFEEPPLKSLFYELLWEYAIGATYYWLEDDSPNYVRTTQMLDKSLALLDAVLASKVFSRGVDLMQFLVREHILARLPGGSKARVTRRRPGKRPVLTEYKAAPRPAS